MSIYGGPDITTDGLILNMDFASTKCYPGSGTSCFDLSSNNFIGEIVNNPPYNNTVNNKYFNFNGATGSRLIRIPNTTILDTQTPSVEVWMRTDNTTQNGFWFEKGTVNTQYSLFQEGASIRWRHFITGVGVSSLSATTASVGVNTTSWFQVVGTYISGSRKLYLNGQLISSDTRTGTIATNNGGMSIGVYGGYTGATGRSYWYTGDIAVVRVYNKELSTTEILQNFNTLKGRFGR